MIALVSLQATTTPSDFGGMGLGVVVAGGVLVVFAALGLAVERHFARVEREDNERAWKLRERARVEVERGVGRDQ